MSEALDLLERGSDLIIKQDKLIEQMRAELVEAVVLISEAMDDVPDHTFLYAKLHEFRARHLDKPKGVPHG